MSWVFSLLPSILQWQAQKMVRDSCWLLHLRLWDAQGTQLLYLLLLLLLRCYMVKPVAAINTVVRLRFSSSLCSFKLSVVSVDQVADLSLSRLLQFWSICSSVWSSLQHRQAAHGTIFHACVRSVGCALFPVSPVSLVLTYYTVLGILLLTWHHKRFGNGGLFLVAHISTWLCCLCTFLCEIVCILISRNSAMGKYPLKGHSAVVAE